MGNNLRWRRTLEQCKGTFNGNFTAKYDSVTEEMQAWYPGKYTVEEYFDQNTLTFDLRLKFATPEAETWFRLKYE